MNPYYAMPFSPTPKHKFQDPSWIWIILFVLALHFAGLMWTWLFSQSPPRSSPQKVIVQTVQLNPRLQPMATHASAPTTPMATPQPQQEIAAVPSPVVEPKEIAKSLVQEKPQDKPVSTPIKAQEESQTPSKHVAPPPKIETEVPAKPKETPKTTTTPVKKATPAPAKTEAKPAAAAAKPAAKQEVKKTATTPAKPAAQAPVKSSQAAAKPAKTDTKKEEAEMAAAKEAEHKRQQELAAAKAKQQELLAKAQENLAKMDQSRGKIESSKGSLGSGWNDASLPKAIGSLQIDALPVGSAMGTELSAKEMDYRDEVAYRLKLALRLPDYGSVKIKLTLDRSGKVSTVQTVSSESKKNQQYVENNVPSLVFPSFGVQFAGLSQYTFLVTLNNDT